MKRQHIRKLCLLIALLLFPITMWYFSPAIISMAMMEGHKLDLFWLHLTFFGWDILASLTGNLGYILLNPYTNMANAVFYRQLTDEYAAVV